MAAKLGAEKTIVRNVVLVWVLRETVSGTPTQHAYTGTNRVRASSLMLETAARHEPDAVLTACETESLGADGEARVHVGGTRKIRPRSSSGRVLCRAGNQGNSYDQQTSWRS